MNVNHPDWGSSREDFLGDLVDGFGFLVPGGFIPVPAADVRHEGGVIGLVERYADLNGYGCAPRVRAGGLEVEADVVHTTTHANANPTTRPTPAIKMTKIRNPATTAHWGQGAISRFTHQAEAQEPARKARVPTVSFIPPPLRRSRWS